MKLKCVVGNNKKTHVWCDVCVEVRGEGGYNLFLNVFKGDVLGSMHPTFIILTQKCFFPIFFFV